MTTEKPENQPKKTYTEKTYLGGPMPSLSSPAPCRIVLSSEALAASGMFPGYDVQVTAQDGVITIERIGPPAPGIFGTARPKPSCLMDELMSYTRQREASLQPPVDELAGEQIDREEL